MNKIYLIEDSRHPASCTLLAVAKIKSNNKQTTSTKNRQKINSKIEFFDEIFHIYVKILWIEKKIIFFFTKMLYMIKLIAIHSNTHFCGKKKWLEGWKGYRCFSAVDKEHLIWRIETEWNQKIQNKNP